jgi:hypothetical protein
MNKNIVNFIVTLLLSLLFSMFLPWWSIMIAALLAAIILPLKKTAVFFVPFFAVFLIWSVYAFILSSANNYTLANKIATLLPLGGNPYLLILVSGCIGGIAAGVSGILGKQIVSLNNQ